MALRLIVELRVVNDNGEIVDASGHPFNPRRQSTALQTSQVLCQYQGDAFVTSGGLQTPAEQAQKQLNNFHYILREAGNLMMGNLARS